jgi:hypothetical protein
MSATVDGMNRERDVDNAREQDAQEPAEPLVLDGVQANQNSLFRDWFERHLRPLTDRRLEWPQLLRKVLESEFNRLRLHGQPYAGPRVFINRDGKSVTYADRPDQHLEVLSVYRLYRETHEQLHGALIVGGEPIWLVTCQTPNQGYHQGRRADLVGIRMDGSLALFECKAATNNSDSPFFALMEGLDYLGHLLIEKNLKRFRAGLSEWRKTHGNKDSVSHTPPGFEAVNVNEYARHSVVVLAPDAYYQFHRLDSARHRQGWEYLSERAWPDAPACVRLDFAVTDFLPLACTLLPLEL